MNSIKGSFTLQVANGTDFSVGVGDSETIELTETAVQSTSVVSAGLTVDPDGRTVQLPLNCDGIAIKNPSSNEISVTWTDQDSTSRTEDILPGKVFITQNIATGSQSISISTASGVNLFKLLAWN